MPRWRKRVRLRVLNVGSCCRRNPLQTSGSWCTARAGSRYHRHRCCTTVGDSFYRIRQLTKRCSGAGTRRQVRGSSTCRTCACCGGDALNCRSSTRTLRRDPILSFDRCSRKSLFEKKMAPDAQTKMSVTLGMRNYVRARRTELHGKLSRYPTALVRAAVHFIAADWRDVNHRAGPHAAAYSSRSTMSM